MVKSTFYRAINHLFHFYSRKDLREWDYTPANHPKIYGVYHVYCVNDWKALVEDQISALRDSGLFAETSMLYISCIVSCQQDVEDLQKIVGEDKCQIISIEHDGKKYEFPALEFMHKKSKEEDFLVYYFHTKGVSLHFGDLNYNDDTRTLRRNSDAWRKMMEYFVFYKYKVAINVLGKYDTYGTYYKEYSKCRFYAGNFWWTTASYIRTLPKLQENCYENRFLAEYWLLQTTNNYYSAFDTEAVLYKVLIYEGVYKSKRHLSEVLLFAYNYYKYWIVKLVEKIIKSKHIGER